MNNTALKRNLSAIRHINSHEVNILSELLITDPIKIISEIDFWKTERANNPDTEERERCDANIKRLKFILEKGAEVTAFLYGEEDNTSSIEDVESISKKAEDIVDGKIKNISNTEDPKNIHSQSANETAENADSTIEDGGNANQESISGETQSQMKVATDAPNSKELREKYQKFIKVVTIDELKKYLPTISKEEGIEMANFILRNGLYKGKKAKAWTEVAVDKLIQEVYPTVNETEESSSEELQTAETVEEMFSGFKDNVTLSGLSVEVKLLSLNDGKPEKAADLAAYILSNGFYITGDDSEPRKFTEEEISNFIAKSIEGCYSNVETRTIEEPKKDNEKEVKFIFIMDTLKQQIFDKKIKSQEEAKQFIKDWATIEKLEVLSNKLTEDFSNFDELWSQLFEHVVTLHLEASSPIKDPAELDKTIEEHFKKEETQSAIESNTLKRIDIIKFVRDIAHNINKNFNLQDAVSKATEIMKKVNPKSKFLASNSKDTTENETSETKKEEVSSESNIILGDVDKYSKEYPDLWKQINEAKYLSNIYNIAKDNSTKDTFAIACEMIFHVIGQKQIKEKESSESPLDWSNTVIENWFNQFKSTEDKSNEGTENETSENSTEQSQSDSIKSATTEKEFDEAVASQLSELMKRKEMNRKTATMMVTNAIKKGIKVNNSYVKKMYRNSKNEKLYKIINDIAVKHNIPGFEVE